MVEPVRTGVRNAMLDPQRSYQLLIPSQETFTSRLDEDVFDRDFHKQFLVSLQSLAYFDKSHKPINVATRNQALENCSKLVGKLFKKAEFKSEQAFTQIDLVLSFDELTQLPFETLTIPDGEGNKVHLGDHRAGKVILTRRIRGAEIQKSGPWPIRPRVLFAWAAADAKGQRSEPEHKKHYDALRDAFLHITPSRTFEGYTDVIPDAKSIITELKDASLHDIETACIEARDENAPYTHVHMLAHGVPIAKKHQNCTVYGVRLRGEDSISQDVSSEDLCKALSPMLSSCRAVTLAICDGGNETSLLEPGESLAHKLHEAGFPVVIGSQFPLTFGGSSIMVSSFYRGEANGLDVRESLLEMRRELFDYGQEQNTHDWAAITPYVRLPDDYRQRLFLTSTGADLLRMEAASDRMGKLIAANASTIDRYREEIDATCQHADALKLKLKTVDKEPDLVQIQFLKNEILGLIASSAKRRAEWYWELAKCFADYREELVGKSRHELNEARDWYKRSAEDLNNHWGVLQAAATEIITLGDASNNLFLKIGRMASENVVASESDLEKVCWAHGTLMECELLEGHIDGSTDIVEIVACFNRLKATSHGKDHPPATTIKTLIRYRDWWTKENGFFRNSEKDLSEIAARVLEKVKGSSS
ncbi:CHAT domain-containing protein [Ruegeria sp. THAF33]|uniref:CHAT domain-containing protein n=1 Tax=Ruegeria sp. THAF33 TaxID=2587853 RepID=UPI0012AA8125|nr:CHAT domain-containing protein [Ruegeria sp. THAF33]QFT71801.1 CHAT domain protein [Ruegeria sp. THAF33]